MYSSLYIPAICRNMDGPRDYHTKWSKPDRERQGILKTKKDTSEFMYKTKTDPQTQRTNLQLQKGKEGTEKF